MLTGAREQPERVHRPCGGLWLATSGRKTAKMSSHCNDTPHSRRKSLPSSLTHSLTREHTKSALSHSVCAREFMLNGFRHLSFHPVARWDTVPIRTRREGSASFHRFPTGRIKCDNWNNVRRQSARILNRGETASWLATRQGNNSSANGVSGSVRGAEWSRKIVRKMSHVCVCVSRCSIPLAVILMGTKKRIGFG